MTRLYMGALALLGLTAACGPSVLLPSDEESATTQPSPTPEPGMTTGTVTPGSSTVPPGESTGVDDDTTDDAEGGFILPSDVADGYYECDIFTQNCPSGQKCMPYADDGGWTWNAWGCFPIAEDPADPGEPCTVTGSGVSGMDDCELASMCWDVDPETNEGFCVAFCVGGPSGSLTCEDPDTSCATTGDGVLALCIPACDPLAYDCPRGQACYPINDGFLCATDTDSGTVGDPCEYINACESGTFCAAAEVVPGCVGSLGCCSSFCDLNDENPPCLPGQVCEAWYEKGQEHPGLDHVGGCALPM